MDQPGAELMKDGRLARHFPTDPQARSSPARAIRAVALSALALLLLWKTLDVVLVIFAGILLAVFLTRAAGWVSRWLKLGPALSLLIVTLCTGGVILGLGWLFTRSVWSQIDELSRRLPQAFENLRQRLRSIEWLQSIAPKLGADQILGGVQNPFGIAFNSLTVIGGIVVIVFFGLYLAAEHPVYEQGILHLVPERRRGRAAEVLRTAGDVLWYWSLGRLFSITTLGVTTWLGLWLLGIPLSIALGTIAGALALVPYLGAIVAAVPSLLMALTIDLRHVGYVVGLYVALHVLEGYVLIPLVQRRATHVPPAVTLAAQLVMGLFAGVLGVALAMPLAALLIPVVRMLYVEDVLGAPEEPPGRDG
ncbi:MAG TPA: AI-2E family transporter [Dongiaceae bacterium]|nr:AI-2E family transporter [Dongiaceae bacterium]